MGLEKDLPPGEQLLACLRPFLEHLVSSTLSPKTIRRHVDNLWMLGGEIIRDLHYDPSLRKMTAHRLLRSAVHEDGGPLIHNGSEEEQTLLRRHLPQTPPLPHPGPALSPPVTHKFPGRAAFIAGAGISTIVRVLVLPGHFNCCHEPALHFLSSLPRNGPISVSIRAQYSPDWKITPDDGNMARRPTPREILEVRRCAGALGLQLA